MPFFTWMSCSSCVLYRFHQPLASLIKYSAPSGPHCGCCTEVSLPPATNLQAAQWKILVLCKCELSQLAVVWRFAHVQCFELGNCHMLNIGAGQVPACATNAHVRCVQPAFTLADLLCQHLRMLTQTL